MQDEQRGHTPGEGTHTFHSLSGVRYQGGAHRASIVLQNPQVKKEIIGHMSFDISDLSFEEDPPQIFAGKHRSNLQASRDLFAIWF